jgi:hypothetical protein
MLIGRNTQIPRLPYAIREELNCRLLACEPTESLLRWLNGHPQVREILADSFGGAEIDVQNLCDWSTGGYSDWFQYQKRIEWARSLGDEVRAMEEAGCGSQIFGQICVIAGLGLGKLLRNLCDTHDQGESRQIKANGAQSLLPSPVPRLQASPPPAPFPHPFRNSKFKIQNSSPLLPPPGAKRRGPLSLLFDIINHHHLSRVRAATWRLLSARRFHASGRTRPLDLDQARSR